MLVSKAALDAGRSVAIYSLPRLLNLLRESMDSEGGCSTSSTGSPPSTCCTSTTSAPRTSTDWVLEQLYSIVNARYEAERAIVATTNLMPDELSEPLGQRTVSRLVEICGDLIPLYGEDKRREFRAGSRRSRRAGRSGARRRAPVNFTAHAGHSDSRRPVGR